MKLRLLIFFLVVLSTCCIGKEDDVNLLFFYKTNGYRHAAIPNAIKAFAEISHEQGWTSVFTDDSTFFNHKDLSKYDAVVFLLTTEDVLGKPEQEAFEKYIRDGGAFVGVHSATNTEYDWPWFGQLIGAYFVGHPPVQDGLLHIEDRAHPSTTCFERDTIRWNDEWYTYDKNPRDSVNVLISIDESSYNTDHNPWFEGELAMGDHPLAWYHIYDGGRVFQTSLGHRPELYDDPLFRKHLIGGVEWAIGQR